VSTFPALVVREPGPASFEELSDADLPEGDVTVAVEYSSLNYKDGLAVTGQGRIARRFPMVCGIDLAGTVEASDTPAFAVGDEVVLTGWGLSETHPGGYTRRQRVRSEWLVHRPEQLSLLQTMAIGTAGLTAMLCIMALEHAGLANPGDDTEVLVTGASGGVGSVAVALLAVLGHRVAASTGRPERHDYLRSLGVSTIVERGELSEPGRPLAAERWAAAVDTVGSQTLATVLSQVRYGGAVAACGLVGGNDLRGTVLPFILRNVSLLGIDSVQSQTPRRTAAWRRLAFELPPALLDTITSVAPLSAVPALAADIVEGKVSGRVVIDTAG
jgi:acrylyl-CoA reductase (NADPH)